MTVTVLAGCDGGFPHIKNPDLSNDRKGVRNISLALRDNSFLHRLSLQVQERAPIGPAYGVEKVLSDLTTQFRQHNNPIKKNLAYKLSGQVGLSEKPCAIELAQWVDSCTCKIMREKLKENSRFAVPDRYMSPSAIREIN